MPRPEMREKHMYASSAQADIFYFLVCLIVYNFFCLAEILRIPLLQEFKRNLRTVNGGEDFPANLLEEIYHAIR